MKRIGYNMIVLHCTPFRYNTSNNWIDFTSMVSDIRTVCPLLDLANRTNAPMYLATKQRATEFGLVADSTSDIAAIFSDASEDAFNKNMKTMFFDFVKKGESFSGIKVVENDVKNVESLENCDFWRESDPLLVQDFGKVF